MQIDLPPLNIPPAYVSPYGVGIRRGDKELHDAIALALLAAMDKVGGCVALAAASQCCAKQAGERANMMSHCSGKGINGLSGGQRPRTRLNPEAAWL